MTGSRRPISANDWYSAYFAPTTILIAATVLVVSWQAGRYAGNLSVQRDRDALVPALLTNSAPLIRPLPAAHQAPTKAAGHSHSAKANASTSGKTSH